MLSLMMRTHRQPIFHVTGSAKPCSHWKELDGCTLRLMVGPHCCSVSGYS